MKKINSFINKLSTIKKITILFVIITLVILISIVLPTFSRLKNRNTLINVSSWDGEVASNFRKGEGTSENPYVISNGSELAYFEKELENTNFENKFIQINSDIIINEGKFKFEDNNLIYILKNKEYYVNTVTNKYYDNKDFSGDSIGTLNLLKPMNNFKGTLNGGLHTIYGYYLTGKDLNEKGLFTNLQGNINNLYMDNTFIDSSNSSACLASSASNSIIKNVMTKGIVLNNTDTSNNTVTSKINDLSFKINEVNNNKTIHINKNYGTVGSTINKTSLKGTLEINNPNKTNIIVKINNTVINEGDFTLDLGNLLTDSISLSITSEEVDNDLSINLKNMQYDLSYNYKVSGGVIGKSTNNILNNVINKSYINGLSVAGGLIGLSIGKIDITNSYNKANIDSVNISGGIIGSIENSSETTIIDSYNTGDTKASISGGLIASLYNNTLDTNITNSFTTGYTTEQDGYPIGSIIGSSVNVTNSYYVNGTKEIGNNAIYNGIFIHNDINNLYTNDYLKYGVYVSSNDVIENPNNVWLFESNELPILFFDDISNPIASLHASIYSWNNLSTELDKIGFNDNISFSIANIDDNKPYKEAYYYISKSSTPLNKSDLNAITNWTLYSDIVKLDPDDLINGQYIIYVKIIDQSDNISYINSDILCLDETAPNVSIQMDDISWNIFNNSVNNLILDRNKLITITATDIMSGIKNIEYYISGDELSLQDIENLSSTSFKEYDKPIEINTVGEQIIYVKATDISGNITYVNTDKLILDGYEISNVYAGSNLNNYDGTNITEKSKISIDINYNNYSNIVENQAHNLVSNILLPKNTKITLIDFNKNKTYVYNVDTDGDIYGYNDSCLEVNCEKKATYPFTDFKEVGSISKNIKYKEDTYSDIGKIDEDFTITLDFENAEITKDYLNSKFYMELKDNNNKTVRPTLYNTIKSYNLYKGSYNGYLSLTTDYNNINEIELNSQSQTNIQINSIIDYFKVNNNSIYDTKYENMKIGLGVKLVDENDNIIPKEKMDNIIIRYNDKEFTPENDNMFHINLNNGIKDTVKNIQIITYENDNKLKSGKYYFKLFNYLSTSGYTYEIINNNMVTVNAKLTRNSIKYKYELNVKSDNSKSILEKGKFYELKYNITQISELDNPSIKVSLYKKNNLQADNQDYTLIDLKDYTSDSLNEYINSIYTIIDNPKNYVKDDKTTITNFDINLNTTKLEKYGYKIVFTLYDGTNIVGSSEKYYIIK